MKLLEDRAKAWLRRRGLPVPDGRIAATAQEAATAAEALGGRVAVKALVATGRRGKAGAVKLVNGPDAALSAASEILRMQVAGLRCRQVYVERAMEVREELYLSFGFGKLAPQIVASRRGGVDIESVAAQSTGDLISVEINPLRGLTPWRAAEIWDNTGIPSKFVPALAALSVNVYEAFYAADALILELNPIAITADGALSLIGAMMEVDSNALFRHPEWRELGFDEGGPGGRPLNERERAVMEADRKFIGGAIRYTELPGEIALFLAGGGAGLLQHDLVLEAGGRPANHSDLSPANVEKPAALFDAIFTNPGAKGLLVGMNYLQMLPCTLVTEALLVSMNRNKVDPTEFPIVLRVFGPREEEARAMIAGTPGVRYMPSGASLEDAVREIVAAVSSRRTP
jgi:succinyl-CoA synthetase beta subunit